MIVREEYATRSDGVRLYRTYSDENCFIMQNETGIEYTEAIDVEGAPYTYSEGEKLPEETISAQEALEIILGGEGL